MDKYIRIGLYKILRKLGAERTEIFPEAKLQGYLFFDHYDWTCFMFYIETKFDLNFSIGHEQRMNTINDVIQLISIENDSANKRMR